MSLLKLPDIEAAIGEIEKYPLKRAINTLIPLLLNPDPVIRWRSVSAAGALIARLARDDLEAGRVFIRRMIWNLSEESGTCAWGAPEVMAEAMALDDRLAKEFGSILVSYAIPGENFLDHDPLRRGAVWGVGRLAQKYPEMTGIAMKYFCASLKSDDEYIRGYSCWALSFMDVPEGCQSLISDLVKDNAVIELYVDRRLRKQKISDIAESTLECFEAAVTD